MITLQEHLQRAQMAIQQQDWPGAAKHLKAATMQAPSHPEVIRLQGVAAYLQSDFELAAGFFRRLVERHATDIAGWHALGASLAAVPQATDAEAAFRQVLRWAPTHFAALNDLGDLLKRQGRSTEAEQCWRSAIEHHPAMDLAHYNLAVLLQEQRRLSEALAEYDQALSINAKHPAAWNNRGNVLVDLGRWADAAASLQRVIELQPEQADAYYNLGRVYHELQQWQAASDAFSKALQLKPDFVEAMSNLASVWRQAGLPMAAESMARQALNRRPDLAIAWSTLAMILLEQGRHDEALAAIDHALTLDPTSKEAQSNRLFIAIYHPTLTAEWIANAFIDWGKGQGGQLSTPKSRRSGRIRVGYLSPDFRHHPVTTFIEPILAHHDLSKMEMFAYAHVAAPDEVTERLIGLFGADHWRSLLGLTDDDAEALILADDLDILIDLAGHTRGHRLGVLSRHPARILATYLGYGQTTGLAAMDYFLTDARYVPAEFDHLFVEKVWRLPRSMFAYRPPSDIPSPSALPRDQSGHMTFGCFSRAVRLTQPTLLAFAQILQRLPESQLILNAQAFNEPAMVEQTRQWFASQNVPEHRVFPCFTHPQSNTWDAYGLVDVALDPFPHNAGTTTFEALWLGVPVVSLAARPPTGRFGCAILGEMGLTQCLAANAEEYVERAVALATDPELGALRQQLRPLMEQSALRDERGLAAAMEQAYIAMVGQLSAS